MERKFSKSHITMSHISVKPFCITATVSRLQKLQTLTQTLTIMTILTNCGGKIVFGEPCGTNINLIYPNMNKSRFILII